MITTESPGIASRAALNKQAAQEIYRCKLQLQVEREDLPHRAARSALRGQSLRVSYMFDVSPKTIRDIWSHRTWHRATFHLWEGSDVRESIRRNRQRDFGLKVCFSVVCDFAKTIKIYLTPSLLTIECHNEKIKSCRRKQRQSTQSILVELKTFPTMVKFQVCALWLSTLTCV
jgi:hypothetical protein